MEACLIESVADPAKIILSAVSIGVAALLLFVLKEYKLTTKKKIALIYGHLTSLFFPLVIMGTTAVCGFFCLPCGSDMLILTLYALPSTLLVSTIAGFILIPSYYLYSSRGNEIKSGYFKSFIKSSSRKLGIKEPKFYVLNKAEPVAFSFKNLMSGVFVSAGMFDVLRKKELEAVILHELAHIKLQSSIFKMSAFLMKFSPFSLMKSFTGDFEEEELKADEFVVKKQGTDKYILSAKNKTSEWKGKPM